MTLDELVSRLQKVKRTAKGFSALCPAHDDNNPSLSICERDGRILIHCFAGCGFKEVLSAMGLGVLDLHPEYGQTDFGRKMQRLSRPASKTWEETRRLMADYGITEKVAKAMVSYRLSKCRRQHDADLSR